MPATLSFARPGWVTFTLPGGRYERRLLEAPAPFASWSRAYEAAGDAADLRALGLAIGAWLDGPQHWLSRLVAEGRPPLVVEIEVWQHPDPLEQEVLEAPWELAALPRTSAGDDVPTPFLALDPALLFCPVRRLGPAGPPSAPSPHRPSIVALVASPEGQRALDVAREEAEIVRRVGGIGVDLHVEDSGTLARLSELVARLAPIDILHVSCHGTLGPPPALLLEDDQGRRRDTTAQDLAYQLAGQAPALTFLSACMTATASTALTPLAIELCQRGWPAVLGWSAPVTNTGAIVFAAELYRLIARRLPLVEAMAHARAGLAGSARGSEWHKPRIHLGASAGGKLVDGVRPRDLGPVADSDYLDPDTAHIPVRGPFEPFPHRRSFQRALAALGDRTAGVVHGGTALDRATFARRLARRMPGHRELLLVGELDAAAVLAHLRSQLVATTAAALLDDHAAAVARDPSALAVVIRALIEGPCARRDEGAVLLVWFGLETMLTNDPESAVVARPHQPTVQALLRGFAGAATESRLILASAASFRFLDEHGADLRAALWWEGLDPSPPVGPHRPTSG